MARKTKFVKGEIIYTVGQLAELVRQGEWVYWCCPSMTSCVPKHPSIIGNMLLSVLQGAIDRRQLYCALPRDKAVICGYGDCGNTICRHRRIHLPSQVFPFNCGDETHYCDYVFGPVRCISIAEWEARHA